MFLVRKPVARVVPELGLREGSTGRVVYVAPESVKPERARLERVWAVAEVVPPPAGNPTRECCSRS